MADYSLIEFGVYGFIAYTSILMLIISTIKSDIPKNDSLAVARVIYLIPGIICAFLLAGTGEMISWTTETTTINNNITALGKTPAWDQTFLENGTVTQTTEIQLQSPVWILVHYLIGLVLVIYVITQILHLFGIQSNDHTK